MASTSTPELAREILDCCLRGVAWSAETLNRLVDAAAASDPAQAAASSRDLFSILIEGLADRFQPDLADAYAALFSRVIERVRPEFRAADLESRYRRIRRAPPVPNAAGRVYVLSRVTLGADVAVASVLLAAARSRFPDAEIHLVGSRKAWELFSANPDIRHTPAPYARSGTLAERLDAGLALRDLLGSGASIVLDPDSRLTQLGLLPVCGEDRYFFFESRAYGGDSPDSLPVLASRWAAETLGIHDAKPFVAPLPGACPPSDITVSLGVGENPAKRIADPFEPELIRMLWSTGKTVLIDKGASEAEARRVETAIARSGAPAGRVQTWQGAFAPFAAAIARSRLYVGYDSAGQHVAAARQVPLLVIFAGFPCERMFQRWRPYSAGPAEIVRAQDPDPARTLAAAADALKRLGHFP